MSKKRDVSRNKALAESYQPSKIIRPFGCKINWEMIYNPDDPDYKRREVLNEDEG